MHEVIYVCNSFRTDMARSGIIHVSKYEVPTDNNYDI